MFFLLAYFNTQNIHCCRRELQSTSFFRIYFKQSGTRWKTVQKYWKGLFYFPLATNIKLLGQVWEITLKKQDESKKEQWQLTSCEKCCWCTCVCSSLVTLECRGSISTSLMASIVTCCGRTWKREVTYIKMDFLSGQAVATSERQINMHHFSFRIRQRAWENS